MRTQFIIFTLLLVCCFFEAKSQTVLIENDWVKKDSIFIDSLATVIKANPLNIENFRRKFFMAGEKIIKTAEQIEKLGFDYDYVSGDNYGILYKIVYYRNKLIGFSLKLYIAKDKILTSRYLEIHARLFKLNDNQSLDPFVYNFDELSKPLPGYKGTSLVINEEIKFFMTPFSRLEYGLGGGEANDTIQSRAYFEKIKKYITPEICEYLMYSKNPATRLYAVEYYYKNERTFKGSNERIENRIKLIFNELPQIRTYYSDVYSYGNAKELVYKYILDQ